MPLETPENKVRCRRCWQKVSPAKNLSFALDFCLMWWFWDVASQIFRRYTYANRPNYMFPLRNIGACFLHLNPVGRWYLKPASSDASPHIPSFIFFINSTIAVLQQQWPSHILAFKPRQTFHFQGISDQGLVRGSIYPKLAPTISESSDSL